MRAVGFSLALSVATEVFSLVCTDLKIIQNVKDLSAGQKRNLQLALHAMKHIPSQYNESYTAYDYFPYAHSQVAVNSSTFVGGRPVHGSWWFLPWHREIMHRLDEELKRGAAHVDIYLPVHFPYWNFSDPLATDVFFSDDLMGGYGQFHGQHDPSNYALRENDNHPFGPQTNWNIARDLRFLHAEQASEGSLVRSHFGNGQMGCLDVATRTKHYKLPGADNPPSLDSFDDVIEFAGGTRLDPLPNFFGIADPGNERCERTDTNCDKFYHNVSTGESIVCHVYGGSLPTWTEMQRCRNLPFEDDVNYNFTTLPTFLVPCLEGMNSSDPFSLPGEMAGASWHSPHGKSHAFTGGTSGESPASPNDPIFFGIHAMMDYLWFENQLTNDFMDPWFAKHTELLDMNLPFFGTKVRDTLDAVGHYGFAYDTQCGYRPPGYAESLAVV